MTALTRTQRRNLGKLATYLEGLPRRYRHFEMLDFTGLPDSDPEILRYVRENGGVANCGTVACAVGHGPAAGILFKPEEISQKLWDRHLFFADWNTYTERFVPNGQCGDVEFFDWAFGCEWSGCDNHHWGAAARIRYLLKHGKPPSEFEFATRKWREVYREFDKRYASVSA